MAKIKEWPFFTEALTVLLLPLVCGFALAGCKVKQQRTIEVSSKILNARTADFDELLAIVNQYRNIFDLKSSSMKVTLTLGKWESGSQEEYHRAPGYILLRQPSSLHVVIQNPVIIKTTLFEAVSNGDEFSAWIRDTNKVYKGLNSAKELVSEDRPDGIPLRPDHLYEAIIPAGIDMTEPGLRISLEESADKISKYYIMSVYTEGVQPLIHVVRRIWIERSQLAISRVQSFNESGRLTGDIEYSEMMPVDGFLLPMRINLDRPEDGYALALEFSNGSWGVNSELDDDSFVLPHREGAEVVILREK